ncbi:MAG TPA: sulfatase-like hydrolase/transferase [Stellaceae bacterium]|jgi:choline-sulfatase|nr:sulfatase-like hydrolase/transferase [Stellaceae bacterium]
MNPANLLFILSDEHSRRVLGCYGHEMIRTPNLDRLAQRGVRFSDAYTNSPICVPARASLATGRYPHRIRFWDNAIAYDGSVPSWHHRLRDASREVVSIGKLHFRSADDDNGFTQEVMPLHINDGIGDPMGWLRDPLPVRKATLRLARDAGRGDSSYQDYDCKITDAAVDWLKAHAGARSDKPWALFVSLVCPHFPLIARPEFYDLYPEESVPLPRLRGAERGPDHPYIAALRQCQIYQQGFADEANVRRAIAAYFGLVSFTDHNVGRLLAVLDAAGLAETTRVIYSADHGDNLGTRELWGKSTMYEEAAGVPLIVAGPGLPEGIVCREPVSLADCFPTALTWTGVPPQPEDRDLPGLPLDEIVRHSPNRTVLSEYHATGAATGAFMIRKGPFKFVYYVGMPPQLFDLDTDPQETRDLVQEAGYQGLVADCEKELRAVVDPEAADALAKADQRARIEAFGGRDKILNRGSFAYSPAPGTEPVYN